MPATKETITERVTIPPGVSVSVVGSDYTVKGPKGTVTKRVLTPRCTVVVEGNTMIWTAPLATRREGKIINTCRAHLRNLFKGVTEGHVYKLKICSGHFPMTVSAKNNLFEVKNFFGETVARKIQLPSTVTIKITAPEILVEGIDLDTTAQAAASIEQLVRRPGFDFNRFQDGIYIVEKDGKPVM